MKKIPGTENPLALRTDFSPESIWNSLCAELQDPDDEFSPALDFISDPAFAGVTADQLPSLMIEDSPHPFAFIIDQKSLTHPEHPNLVIDLQDNSGRTFRVTPVALADVANNLSIANMGFAEFADVADQDGIFCGFPGS